MARNALILHGTQGNSNENWFPWLKSELEKKGYKVWLPDLPGADLPNLEKYNKFIFSNKNFDFNSDTVIVGHSSGSVAILALLNELPKNVMLDTCVLVAPFEKDSPGGQWEPNRELFDYKFDLKKVKKHCQNFVLLISDNDKYCPVEYVRKLGRELNGKVVETHGDGHFSASSGGPKYKKLPIILQHIIGDDELLDLVNEKDDTIGTVWKSVAHGDPDKIHREIAIALFNETGETLLQRRSMIKKYHAGMWQITAAGHVGVGESPEKAAAREIFEEVGIRCNPVFVRKEFIKDFKEARFFYVYYALVKGKTKFKLDSEEVMDAKWIKPSKIDNFASENNFEVDWKSKDFVQRLITKINFR